VFCFIFLLVAFCQFLYTHCSRLIISNNKDLPTYLLTYLQNGRVCGCEKLAGCAGDKMNPRRWMAYSTAAPDTLMQSNRSLVDGHCSQSDAIRPRPSVTPCLCVCISVCFSVSTCLFRHTSRNADATGSRTASKSRPDSHTTYSNRANAVHHHHITSHRGNGSRPL